jgi:outer membrane protein assembly factor BamB
MKWQFALNGWGASPAIGADGTIYAPGQHLYALAPNGTQKWVFPVGQDLWSPTITADGTIVVGAKNSKVFGVRPDGTKRWEFLLDSSLTVSPVVSSDGTIFVHSAKTVYALDATGQMLWSTKAGLSTFFSLALDDAGGALYVADMNQVVAMTLAGGVKWIHNEGIGSELHVGPDGNVYFTGQGMGYPTVALAPDGTKLWSVGTVTGGRVHAVDESSMVYSISTAVGHDRLVAVQNGVVKWSFKPNNSQGGWGLNIPVIDGAGRVIVSAGFKLIALDQESGALAWETPLPVVGGTGSFAAIGADGTVYLRGEKFFAVGN